MARYTDDAFGFSFWYPAAWKVTDEPIAGPTGSGWFQNVTIVKEFSLHNPAADGINDQPPGVFVEELSAPHGVTELGARSASPVGVDQRYFFDRANHRWMYQWLSELGDGTPPGQKPAVIPHTTMGGQPIFWGAVRHGAEVIIPLGASHFLAISTLDAGGDFNHQILAETVTSTLPHAGEPASPQIQAQTVHREAIRLRAIAEQVGYWYRDSENVYDPDGNVLSGANPKTFALVSDDKQSECFATDGIHVYRNGSGVIQDADPKTFVATGQSTALDARHTYDWTSGTLIVGDFTKSQ